MKDIPENLIINWDQTRKESVMLFELPIILSGYSFYIRIMRWELTALLEYLDLFNHFYAYTVSVLYPNDFCITLQGKVIILCYLFLELIRLFRIFFNCLLFLKLFWHKRHIPRPHWPKICEIVHLQKEDPSK